MGCGASKHDENPAMTLAVTKAPIFFVLGGPGSGKGTQCAKLVETLKYVHLSTGDLLREEVAKKSELGIKCDELMKEGKMVPLEITLNLLVNAMKKSADALGFLIDGFPRSLEQAIETVGKAKFVLYFEASEECLIERLLKRGETSGRVDDNLESIKKRLETFRNISMPVIEHYKADSRVKTINSEGKLEDITAATLAVFKF